MNAKIKIRGIKLFFIQMDCWVMISQQNCKTNEPHRRLMVSVRSSSAVNCGFEHWSGQSKDNIIGICCFSAKHAVLRSKSK